MTQNLDLYSRNGLPDALRVLVDDIPREMWEAHPNFGGMVQFWLQRHMMFRRFLEVLESDFQQFTDKNLAYEQYAPRLSQTASTFLGELHGHHNIEDHHYFPQLVKLDTRLEAGFAILDKDHHAMDGVIHGFADKANAVLRAQDHASSAFENGLREMKGLLNRHLLDEEEIIVPVILKSGFDG